MEIGTDELLQKFDQRNWKYYLRICRSLIDATLNPVKYVSNSFQGASNWIWDTTSTIRVWNDIRVVEIQILECL